MENTGLSICAHFLEKFISSEYSDFVMSYPVRQHARLEDFPRIVFVDSGELVCDLGINGALTATPLKEHTVVYGLTGASTGSSYHNDKDGTSFTIGFFPEYIRLVVYRFIKGKSVEFHFHHSPSPLNGAGLQILDSLRSIGNIPSLRNASFLLVRALLEMVRAQMSDGNSMKIGKSARTWQEVEHYINSHLVDETLSRRILVEHFRMNGCYLSALCHKHTNHTLNDFILRKKLSYAVLLLEQHLTVDQIARECGFQQTGYFIQLFRRIYGVTPGKYRSGQDCKRHNFPTPGQKNP